MDRCGHIFNGNFPGLVRHWSHLGDFPTFSWSISGFTLLYFNSRVESVAICSSVLSLNSISSCSHGSGPLQYVPQCTVHYITCSQMWRSLQNVLQGNPYALISFAFIFSCRFSISYVGSPPPLLLLVSRLSFSSNFSLSNFLHRCHSDILWEGETVSLSVGLSLYCILSLPCLVGFFKFLHLKS